MMQYALLAALLLLPSLASAQYNYCDLDRAWTVDEIVRESIGGLVSAFDSHGDWIPYSAPIRMVCGNRAIITVSIVLVANTHSGGIYDVSLTARTYLDGIFTDSLLWSVHGVHVRARADAALSMSTFIESPPADGPFPETWSSLKLRVHRVSGTKNLRLAHGTVLVDPEVTH